MPGKGYWLLVACEVAASAQATNHKQPATSNISHARGWKLSYIFCSRARETWV